MRRILAYLSLSAAVGFAISPNNEWVNIDYLLKQAGGSGSSDTSGARQQIVSSAGGTAKAGPWGITTKNPVLPPSGNSHDYLGWAPYHWPDCNWCSKGATHLMNPSSGGDEPGNPSGGPDSSDPGDDGNSDDPNDPDGDDEDILIVPREAGDFSAARGDVFHPRHRMKHVRRATNYTTSGVADPPRIRYLAFRSPDDTTSPLDVYAAADLDSLPTTGTLSAPALPTQLPTLGVTPALTDGSSQTSIGTVDGTPAPAQAPAKTQHSSCTPSPTKSLSPSATWTTCPYQVRDGKLNPDVRSLPDSPAVIDMTESVFYNCVAYVLQKTSTFSKNAAGFIDAFFLSPSTAMNPNLNFGQLVRGPGQDHQIGTFTGVLDLRGMVKVINGIQMLKAARSPDWTSARDKGMLAWTNQYVSWLQTSDIGKQTAAAPNNHFSFYVNQLTATKMYVGDTSGAISTLQSYFSKQYLDQVAASGEQPFEAVRTRPYHYRCFNLEAMIANAKMGDQLGLNLWTSKSKYGATIQTALDYTMSLDPKDEDVSDIFPHVAAVAAAYGDPKGKYAAFLQKQVSDYKSMPFWFYDQNSALPNAPASHTARDLGELEHSSTAAGTERAILDTITPSATIPFQCPTVFATATEVAIDDGIYVTCDELKPFYEIVMPLESNAP
ncbi:predicted protein [Sparassis crispa]|uniref:Alginate lyase domain-containing protein n=1 Tax=Sparassis crispa TaxID=139825 RepID=A0A401G851_9APHY|nr:predicted protein [Sparassis crispa]GBE78323.1 predicted protein [Sparassis crispa]